MGEFQNVFVSMAPIVRFVKKREKERTMRELPFNRITRENSVWPAALSVLHVYRPLWLTFREATLSMDVNSSIVMTETPPPLSEIGLSSFSQRMSRGRLPLNTLHVKLRRSPICSVAGTLKGLICGATVGLSGN